MKLQTICFATGKMNQRDIQKSTRTLCLLLRRSNSAAREWEPLAAIQAQFSSKSAQLQSSPRYSLVATGENSAYLQTRFWVELIFISIFTDVLSGDGWGVLTFYFFTPGPHLFGISFPALLGSSSWTLLDPGSQANWGWWATLKLLARGLFVFKVREVLFCSWVNIHSHDKNISQ